MSPEEEALVRDVQTVGLALNALSRRAKALGIEMSVSAYMSSSRVDIDLKRETVDFEHSFKGVDEKETRRG